MIKYRIYYSDGSTFDPSMGDIADAPAYGVICIVQPDPLTGRMIMHGWDWYYYNPEDDQFWGSDIFGVLDRLLHRLSVQFLMQGRNVNNQAYSKIMDLADKDPDFEPRSGIRKNQGPTFKQ